MSENKTGYLVPPEAPEVLADRILKILDDPGLASEMGALARKRALEEFSCDKMIRNMESLYAEVLGMS